jgi:hypothetical protein
MIRPSIYLPFIYTSVFNGQITPLQGSMMDVGVREPDQLSGSRVRFGIERGLSRRKIAPLLGIELDGKKESFDEASDRLNLFA